MKKTVALSLIFIILLSQISFATPKLTDIDNHWAKGYIITLTQKGIIAGYPDGTFKPDGDLTVAGFMKLVNVAVKGEDLGNGIPKWYSKYLDSNKELGIIKEGEFDDYNRTISREEMTRMIVRGLGYEGLEGDTDFTDDNKIGEEFKPFVKQAVALGIINGLPNGSFDPQGTTTRGAASKVISLMLDKLEVVNNEVEPLIIGGNQVVSPHPELIEDARKAVELFESLEYGYKEIEYYPEDNKIEILLYESKDDISSEYISEHKSPLITYYIELKKDIRTRLYFPYDITLYKPNNTNAQRMYKEVVKNIFPEIYDLNIQELNNKLADINYENPIWVYENVDRIYAIKTHKGYEQITTYMGLKN